MSYNLEQQAASLSWLSNVLFKAKKPVKELQQCLNDAVKLTLQDVRVRALIGNWEPVWGPCLDNVKYSSSTVKPENKPVCPDNICFVVKRTDCDPPVYLISIAGTNSKSLENICNQDLKVKKSDMIPWHQIAGGNESSGKIALGTVNGLERIRFQLLDNHSDLNTQMNLDSWLKSHSFEAGSHLVTAGHSLGAALCSTLAVWLADNRSVWGGEQVNISTYPTGGPTVGDNDWAQHAMRTLHNQFYGKANSLDAVFLAWNNLDQVKNLYSPWGLKPKIPVRAGLKALQALPGKPNPYCHEGGWVQFQGAFEPDAAKYMPFLPSRTPFLTQILYQHVPAYIAPLRFQEYFALQAQIYPQPE